MRTSTLDTVNIFLMLVSALVSFFIPFELFLFSYAVLGPLHYVTEISWLHGKKYFLAQVPQYVWPLVCGVVLALLTLIGHQGHFVSVYASLITSAFLGALVLSGATTRRQRIIGSSLVMMCAVAIWLSPTLVAIAAILLPTVIHVFLFTASFMLVGALKSNSRLGIIATLLFIILSSVLLLSFVGAEVPHVSHRAQEIYASFEITNMTLLSLLPVTLTDAKTAVYSTAVGLAVMRFLAFVFTYHYLNWFSKTQLIRWHAVSRTTGAVMIGVWLSSVALYLYDYRLGILALSFLSMLHVLLEFPLNQWTFLELGSRLKRAIKT